MNVVDKGEMALIYERARKYFRKQGVIKRSHHFFRVGFEEPYYMDFDAIVNDPNQCEDVTLLYRDKIWDIARQRHIDFLAPIEKVQWWNNWNYKTCGCNFYSNRNTKRSN